MKIEEEINKKLLQNAEKDLHEYLDSMILNAEWLIKDLKKYKSYLQEEQESGTTKDDIVRWAMNRAQNVTFHFDDGARFIGEYIKAKMRKELTEKQD